MSAPLPASHLILVVEDDVAIRDLLCDLLAEQGYRTLTAGNPSAALAQLKSERPALITLDLGLPGIGGAALLHTLRQIPAVCDIPVAVVSAQRTVEPEICSLAQAVISKPFDLDDLLGVVARLLAYNGTQRAWAA